MMVILFFSVLFVIIPTISKCNAITTTSLSTGNSLKDNNNKTIHSDRIKYDAKPLKEMFSFDKHTPEIVKLKGIRQPPKFDQFLIDVHIGKNPLNRKVLLIDTGIEITWVKSYFPTSASRTSKQHFTTKDGVSGVLYYDVFHIGQNTHFLHWFLLADTVPPMYSSIEGKLGLASLSFMLVKNPYGSSALLDMWKYGGVTLLFGLYLPSVEPNLPEITIGFLNENARPTEIKYSPVTGKFWEFKVDCIQVDNSIAVNSFHAYINTGVSLNKGPLASVDSFYNMISRSRRPRYPRVFPVYYEMNCMAKNFVAFVINGVMYEIMMESLIFDNELEFSCLGTFIGHNSEVNTPWTLGTSFLKNIYTVFDLANKQIGFRSIVVDSYSELYSEF